MTVFDVDRGSVRRRLVASWLGCVVALAGCGGGGGGGVDGALSGSGLDGRETVSGLAFQTGTSLPLRAANAFPGLKFGTLTGVTHAGDGTNRLFVINRHGQMHVFQNRADVTAAPVFLDLSARVDASLGEGGLLGLAFDPSYRTNGYFYVTYVTRTTPRKMRLARFRVSTTDANRGDPASERIVYEFNHTGTNHFGGWIGFGPDGALYLSSGDGEDLTAPQNTASPLGKILRLRVTSTGTYTVPTDNPFGNLVWAYGFRNPWRCSFDRAGGSLWCADVGQRTREEVDRVRRGGNYGWPYYEGSAAYQNPGNLPFGNFDRPMYDYDHSVGVVIIGGYVYRGGANPAYNGQYLYTDASTSNLWAIRLDANGNFASNTLVANNLEAIQSFGEDANGELLGLSAFGRIYRFEGTGASGSASNDMPAVLSATGLFDDLRSLAPTAGLVDFSVRVPFWSDGASKKRWLALPGTQTIGFDADGSWRFPLGTVTVKHFDLPRPDGTARRLETRVMVLRESGWEGATYRWRDDQTEADLVRVGSTGTFATADPATGVTTNVTWTFPSPAQCLNCHTQAAGRVLGLRTAQLNSGHTYAKTGRAANQLTTFNAIGFFDRDIGDAGQYAALPGLAGDASLGERARAYLDVNCAHCHQPGGPTPMTMDLRYGTAQAAMNVVGVAAVAPTVAGAVRVVPGSHATSDLWRRMTTTTANRMPPITSRVNDPTGPALVADWIDSLR